MQYPRLISGSRTLLVAVMAVLLLAAVGCEWSSFLDSDDDGDNNGDDNTPPATETKVPGLSVAASSSDFDATLDATRRAIGNRGNADIIETIDHRNNAQGRDRGVRPTLVILFDDPDRSAPLIAADPRAALDLPTRVLIYRDGGAAAAETDTGTDDNVAVAYTNAAYLAARYDLDGAEDGALDALDSDLQTIAIDASGDDPSAGAASGVSRGEGIEEVTSDNDFATTRDRLADAINNRGNLALIRTIDFQARGMARGLNPSTLLLLGDTDDDIALIRSTQTAGVDLPQKMLVTADDSGAVTIHYNDPGFIADRHGIDNRDDQIDDIATLLAELADKAAGTSAISGP